MALLLCMGAIVPLGYWVRFSQLGSPWISDALGSVAYEIFWILLGVFLFPLASPAKVAITVGLATSAIEFLQLWQPPFLQMLRATVPGRLVLGNTFSWTDFPAYLTGSLAGWQWVKRLRQSIAMT